VNLEALGSQDRDLVQGQWFTELVKVYVDAGIGSERMDIKGLLALASSRRAWRW
jgi:hypothetical protein